MSEDPWHRWTERSSTGTPAERAARDQAVREAKAAADLAAKRALAEEARRGRGRTRTPV